MNEFLSVTITGVSLIAVAIITMITTLITRGKLEHVKRDAAITREQVQNSHTTNLREEQDERHQEVMRGIHRLDKQAEGTTADVRGIRKDIGRIDERVIHIESEKREGK